MPVLTPSASSSVLAGSAFSGIMWNILNHIDKIPVLGRVFPKEKIFEWINQNRVLSFTLTEASNYAMHGVSNPNSTAMAIGGSIVNSFAIFGWIPIRQKRLKRKALGKVLHGA